jgi:multiple sugar transport system permease protein
VPLYLLNSLIVAVGATVVTVFVSTLASYSLSRFPFKGKVLIARGVLFGYMLPGILLVLPYFLMFNRLELINTRWGLVLAHAAMSLPFSIWLLWTFFQTIPRDIEDASKVDGAGRLRVLVSIFVPLATPGIVASGIITFIFSWNDYLFASVIASANRVQTLPLGIALMASRDYLRWEVMLASSGIIIFTVFVLLAAFQKYLLEGFSAAFTK